MKRIATAPGPRSIESNGFGQALVAHTVPGRVSIIDAATLTVLGGDPQGWANPATPPCTRREQIAYVSESKRAAVAVVDLVRRQIVAQGRTFRVRRAISR